MRSSACLFVLGKLSFLYFGLCHFLCVLLLHRGMSLMKWTEGGGLWAYFYPMHRKLARTGKNKAKNPQSISTPQTGRWWSPQTLLKCSIASQGCYRGEFSPVFHLFVFKSPVASCHGGGSCCPAIAAIQVSFMNEPNLRPLGKLFLKKRILKDFV